VCFPKTVWAWARQTPHTITFIEIIVQDASEQPRMTVRLAVPEIVRMLQTKSAAFVGEWMCFERRLLADRLLAVTSPAAPPSGAAPLHALLLTPKAWREDTAQLNIDNIVSYFQERTGRTIEVRSGMADWTARFGSIAPSGDLYARWTREVVHHHLNGHRYDLFIVPVVSPEYATIGFGVAQVLLSLPGAGKRAVAWVMDEQRITPIQRVEEVGASWKNGFLLHLEGYEIINPHV